ncbi:MAG: hypothetical protein QF410_10025 [Planctomycetota bacterium]|jgi:hypothetical protein|nr:hypothetical protein [Deltaproteobacteria bacterium]MDP6539866.1 hypothetical protein [Planctomycetota bacterium]
MARKLDRILRRAPRNLLPGSFIVRALALQGRRFACHNCGDTMFVRYGSGLCPLCYNGRRPLVGLDETSTDVPGHMALAGVLDDPTLDL